MAVLRTQPPVVLDLWRKLKAAPKLGNSLSLFLISPDKRGDEDITNLMFRAVVDGEVIGIVVSFTLGDDLEAAQSPLDNHGKAFQPSLQLAAVSEVAQSLIADDLWRVYFQSADRGRGAQLTLVRGRASQTPDEPFGIKLSFSWGSWLVGFPGDFCQLG